MNYLRNLFVYFENALHPASGWSDGNTAKKKRTGKKNNSSKTSPECFNLRGTVTKKHDKARRSPAP